MPGGCLEQIEWCRETNMTTPSEKTICSEVRAHASISYCFQLILDVQAANICRDGIESVYYEIGDRGVYDIRHPLGESSHAFRSRVR